MHFKIYLLVDKTLHYNKPSYLFLKQTKKTQQDPHICNSSYNSLIHKQLLEPELSQWPLPGSESHYLNLRAPQMDGSILKSHLFALAYHPCRRLFLMRLGVGVPLADTSVHYEMVL